MGGGVDETSGEGGCKEVAESVTLLQHSRYQTACFFGAVFKCSCGCIAVKTPHCNAEERSTSKKLLISLAKSST
jgi:hypothetical protein